MKKTTHSKTQHKPNKVQTTKTSSKMEQVREVRRIKRKNQLQLQSHQLGLNQILKPVLYLAISIILEIVSFAMFNFKTNSGSTQLFPSYILFDVAFWLFVCGLIICTKKNWISNTFFYIALVLKVAVFITNITLYSDFGYLFSLDKLALVPEMMESMNFSFINYPLIIFCIACACVVIALPILFDKFLSKKRIQLKKVSNSIFCLLFFLITTSVGAGCFAAQTALLKTSKANAEISDDKYLFQNMHINSLAYQKFGSCGFYLKELTDIIFKNNGVSKSEVDKTIETYDKNVADRNITASFYGDNLIVIMLESFEWFAIDPYNTPNLWTIKTGTANENIPKQGLVFNNYISNNKTNVSEDLCLLGYMPNEAIYNVKSPNVYATKYSLPNLFKSEGYKTSYFHNWRGKFYNRNETHKDFGFDNTYFVEDFESEDKSTKFNYYNLEADFVEQFMNEIAPTSGRFMSFYTTVSSHGTYTVSNPKFEEYFKTYDSNLEKMKVWFSEQGYTYPEDEKYQKMLREYKSAAIDTDIMLGKLFKHLNDTGLINNTNVVIYSDHNSYYDGLTHKIKGTDPSDASMQKTHVVPLMLFSKNLEPRSVDTFCSGYDLYPTLCEFYGLAYNKTNALGKDIFGPDIANTIYMSVLTGFYNTKCYSKNMQLIQKYDGATDTDIENFKTNVCEFFKKQRTLEIVYNSNRTY